MKTRKSMRIPFFYVTNEKEQSQYINMFKEGALTRSLCLLPWNSPFISHVEQKEGLGSCVH